MLTKICRRLRNYKIIIHKDFINAYYLMKFKIFKSQYGVNKENRDKKIVVSITSFPARIDKIHLCVRSMLLQKMKPDKIVIYLGDKEFEGIALPEQLTKLFRYGVEVRFRKDLKPHTKYYYAMQEFPDSLIITVDDDIYYRSRLIKDLYEAYLKHPACVICTRAHKMLFDENKMLLPYNNWDFESKYVKKETDLLMATGVGGVLYDPSLFIEETFNADQIESLALKNDDVWLKFMEILSGIKTYAIPSCPNKYVVGIWGAEKITLNSQNVGQSKNDIYIANVIKAYNIVVNGLK